MADPPGLLRPLPRRQGVARFGDERASFHLGAVRAPGVSRLRVAWRCLGWARAFARLGLRAMRDRRSAEPETRRRGVRLRQLFEEMGGTGIKIGQQLAARMDLLDYEVCRELGRLADRVPAFPTEQAIAAIERSTGRPLAETFRSFDPEPVGSASIACVYQALLANGAKVAVKVRRPGVAAELVADIRAIGWITRTLEILTLVPPGYFRNFRSELRAMFFQELDFVREARYQTLFRRLARRDRLNWLGAPRVHHELSGEEVLVSEFVDGFLCSEIVIARETGNTEALRHLTALDIDPAVVARRIIRAGWWGRFECPFFHADPHPGNILVEPGNRIVMLDFGACGVTSAAMSRAEVELGRRLEKEDISGAAELAIQNMMPLPHVDTDELRASLERQLWRHRRSGLDKRAEWWERTTVGLWIGISAATKELMIPLPPNYLTSMRASLLYDTLALRLSPDLRPHREFRRYERLAARRRARRAARQLRSSLLRTPDVNLAAETARLRETLVRGAHWLETVLLNLPVEFQSVSRRTAFLASLFLRFVARAVAVTGGAVCLGWLYGRLGGVPRTLLAGADEVLGSRLYQAAIVLLALQTLRRIHVRLLDRDPRT